MDVYLCLKDENRSLHKEKLHYLGTPFPYFLFIVIKLLIEISNVIYEIHLILGIKVYL
jgi:hypothetical protein